MKSRIVLLGPPASGKGTQAEMIYAKYQIPSASPGAILRKTQSNKEDGRLLPDETINGLVKDWILEHEQAFVMDGYPRSVGQAKALDECLESCGGSLDAVLYLQADEATIRDRVQRRVVCSGCGRSYSLGGNVASDTKECPACGESLRRRNDDNLEMLGVRMREYEEKTAPLIAVYSERKLLHTIDATKTSGAVFQSIASILEGQ